MDGVLDRMSPLLSAPCLCPSVSWLTSVPAKLTILNRPTTHRRDAFQVGKALDLDGQTTHSCELGRAS